jgi:hypothetical protein
MFVFLLSKAEVWLDWSKSTSNVPIWFTYYLFIYACYNWGMWIQTSLHWSSVPKTQAVATRYINWYKSRPFDIGGTCRNAFSVLDPGKVCKLENYRPLLPACTCISTYSIVVKLHLLCKYHSLALSRPSFQASYSKATLSLFLYSPHKCIHRCKLSLLNTTQKPMVLWWERHP